METIERGFKTYDSAKSCMELLDAIGADYNYHVECGWYYISIKHLDAINVCYVDANYPTPPA